jgi:hypothetical protein
MCKKLIYLTFFFAFCPMAMAYDIAFYVGAPNPGWYVQTQQMADVATIIARTGHMFKDIQQFDDSQLAAFGAWVDKNTNDGEVDIIWLNGCMPSVLYPLANASPDGSRAEKWLDGGNMIINVGDWFAYCTYEGGNRGGPGAAADNTGTGAANILDLSDGIIVGADGTRLPVTGEGLGYLPSLSLNNPFPTDRPVVLSNVQAPWKVTVMFAGNATQADPVVLVNTQTGGYVAFVNQATAPDDSIADRGVTCAEFIGNWVNHVVMGGPLPPGLLKARGPDPADGKTGVLVPVLQWKAGETAASHDVYLGTNPTLGPGEYKGRTLYLFYYFGVLTPGTTYYWRIDEVEGDGVTIHTGDVWSFTAAPLTAYNPNPADGAKWVAADAELSWSAGATGSKRDVYFGTDQTAVANGTGGTLKSPQQTAKTYGPGTLALDTTYYWRIDEFDLSGTKYPGAVWSFATISASAGIRGYYFNKFMDVTGVPVLVRIDPTINFNWGDPGSPDPVVNVDQFSARWVGVVEALYSEPYVFTTNSDDGIRVWLNDVLIIDSWVDQGATLHSSPAINLVSGQRYGLRVEYYENGGGAVAQLFWESPSTPRQIIPAGALQLPLAAGNPNPSNGAVNVKHTPTLRWSAGEKAAKHNVYFGTDAAAVANATTASAGIYRGQQNLAAKSYVPTEAPLAWNSTYYWRIDEVNAADTWRGSVWNFTTANFIVVDDFEDYTDDVGSRIFQTWKDGYGYNEPAPGYPGNGTGSAVGYSQPPFAEPTTVHGGSQSMPLGYDNSGATGKARYSETVREWASPQDWTVNNLKVLTLYFYGALANAAEQLYVALEDNAAHIKVVNYPDPDAVRAAGWQEWNIELTQFSGASVNLKAVKKMYIGLGNRSSPKLGGTGTIFIDDIRVYPSRCVPSKGTPAADLSGNCVVDAADVDILANLWLDSGLQITPVDPGTAGLVAHYRFEGNANDALGNHNGTANGTPVYTTGKVGQAIDLDGVDDFIETGKTASQVGIGGGAARTTCAWVYTRGFNDGGIWEVGQQTDGQDWSLRTLGTTNTWRVQRWGYPTYDFDVTYPSLAVWVHFALVYDGSAAGNESRLYANGVLIGSQTVALNTADTPKTFRIGQWDVYFFNGLIDELRLYNRALSQAQVAWLAGRTATFSAAADLHQDGKINFKDFAVLADSWLEEILWP